MSDAQTTPALIKRLEQYELRLLVGDQHDRKMADDIGRAAHFLALAAPQPVTNAQAAPSHWAIEESTPNDGFECYFLLRDDITVGEFSGRQTDQRSRHLQDLVDAANRASPVPSTQCAGGVDPGWDECPKCGATSDDACAVTSTNCTCAALGKKNIPHARNCPAVSPADRGAPSRAS